MRLLGLCLSLCIFATSCSEKKSDPRATLLGQVGPDFDLLVVTNPTDLGRSAGEEALQKLHETDSELFLLIASAEGVDKEAAVAVAYSNPVQSAILLPVSNSGKLSRSLEASGWKKSKADTGNTFSKPGSAHGIFVDDAIMWLVRTGSSGDPEKIVAALKGRAGALPAWLLSRMADVAERPVIFCYTLADSTRYFGSVKIDGSAAEARMVRIDTDGLRLTLVGANHRQSPGQVLDAVNPNAALSLALALPTDFNIEQAIEKATGGMYLPDDLRAVITSLDGRLGLSLNLADPTSPDMTDLSNYRLAIGLGTKSGQAKAALDHLSDYARESGVPVNGTTLSFAGKELLKGTVPADNMLLVASPGFRPLAHPASAKDCLAWLRVNLPARSPFLLAMGVETGLTVKADVTPQDALIKIDFPGSDRGFIANIIDIAHNF